MRYRWGVGLALLVLGAGLLPRLAQAQGFPPDSAVQRILEERVALGRNPGIVVALLDERGPRVVATGTAAREGLALDGNTLLEIGSATKVFTSVLLADLVSKGEARLDEPVQDLLPAGARVPEKDGRKITLLDLSTHRSGLPRMPSNFTPADAGNPYADYSPAKMLEFLAGYQLPRAVGAEFEYSNLAVGLLGHALSVRSGKSYEDLLRERILAPLGMTDTGIDLPPALKARVAQGHTAAGTPTPNWDFTALAGAGAIRSTALDMLRFLAANLPGAATRLSPALQMTHEPRNEAMTGHAMALGWLIFRGHEDRPLLWHNGGTGGYRFFMGVDQGGGRAVAVFTNASVSVDDLGFHLLDARNPLTPPQPRVERTAVSVAPEILGRYVGSYELTPGVILTVTMEAGQLFVEVTGQGKTLLLAESERVFFLQEVEAQITFEVGERGTATGLVLLQGGRAVPGQRIGHWMD